jgi:MFS family permease
VSSPLSGWLSDRFGGRWLPVAGMAALAVALAALSFAGPEDAVLSVAARLGLAGLGMGLFQSPNSAAVMSSLPRARLGSGGGLLATARNAGMAAGIGLAGAIVSVRAGPDAAGAGFLAGYALALRAGAVLAVLAAAVTLLGPAGTRE